MGLTVRREKAYTARRASEPAVWLAADEREDDERTGLEEGPLVLERGWKEGVALGPGR